MFVIIWSLATRYLKQYLKNLNISQNCDKCPKTSRNAIKKTSKNVLKYLYT